MNINIIYHKTKKYAGLLLNKSHVSHCAGQLQDWAPTSQSSGFCYHVVVIVPNLVTFLFVLYLDHDFLVLLCLIWFGEQRGRDIYLSCFSLVNRVQVDPWTTQRLEVSTISPSRKSTFDSIVGPSHQQTQPTADRKQYFQYAVGKPLLGMWKHCFWLWLVEFVDAKNQGYKGLTVLIEKHLHINGPRSSNPYCSKVKCIYIYYILKFLSTLNYITRYDFSKALPQT